MKAKLIIFGLLLTVLTIVSINLALKSCDFTPEPNRKEIYETIIKKHDSVGVAAVNRPEPVDTAGLHKLEAFKKRLAVAALRRQLDSIARLQNK